MKALVYSLLGVSIALSVVSIVMCVMNIVSKSSRG